MKLVELAHFTDDVQRMAAFYRGLLGVEPAAQSEGMAIFTLDGVKLFIHRNYSPEEGELPPEDHTAFAIPDVDAACRELVRQGLQVETPPHDYYWGRSAYLRDPDGNLIEITQTEKDQEEST